MLDKYTARIIYFAFAETEMFFPSQFHTMFLQRLVAHLDRSRRDALITELLNIANTLNNNDVWAEVAPLLTGELLDRTFDTLINIRDHNFPRILWFLAPHLSPRQMELAVNAAIDAPSAAVSHPLEGLASYLPASLAERVLPIAFSLSGKARANLLYTLGNALTPDLLAQVLQTVFAPVTEQEIESHDQQSPELRTSASRQIAKSAADHDHRRRQLADLKSLLPYLQEEEATHIKQVLNFVLAEQDVWYLTDGLIILAPYLEGESLDQALELAQNLPSELNRILALAALAPRQEEPLRSQLLEYALNLTRKLPSNGLKSGTAIIDESDQVRALLALAPYLHERLAEYALVMALRLDSLDDRARVAASLALSIPDSAVDWLFDVALKLSSYYHEGRMTIILLPLARRLQPEQKVKAFEAILAIPDYQGSPYREALGHIAQHLRGIHLAHAVEAALAISDPTVRREIIIGMWIPIRLEIQENGVQSYLLDALSKGGAAERVYLILSMLMFLPNELRTIYIDQATQLTLSIEDNQQFLRAALHLLSNLPSADEWLPIIQTKLNAVFANDVLLARTLAWLFEHPIES